jgi:hypothetical protein
MEAGAGTRGNSKSWIMHCPRCKKKDKLYIRKADGRFVCWYCKEVDNFQGSPEYVLAELLGRNPADLRKDLYGDVGPEATVWLSLTLRDFYEDEEVEGKPDEQLPTVEMNPDFRGLDTEWGSPGAKYLEKRGVPLQVAMEYGVVYWPKEKRVVFPVTSQGRLLGWQSRYIEATEWIDQETDNLVKIPKALTYTDLKKDRVLMFSDRIRENHAVLCEGPLDAMKAHLCGGNVASLGKAVSKHQLQLLRTSGISKLYVGLDPDAAPEIKRVVDELYRDVEIYDMRAPAPYADLGEMTMEEVKMCYDAAPRVNRGTIFLFLKDHYERQ